MDLNKLFIQAKAAAAGAEGWFTEKEGRFLFESAERTAAEGVLVEIGSYQGKSTIFLSLGSRAGEGKKVFAIDPHDGGDDREKYRVIGSTDTFGSFKKNIEAAGASELVVPLVMTSEKAAENWAGPVSFLFIDGGHDFECVEKDILMWEKFLVEGGVIAMHDTNAYSVLSGKPGPRKAAEKYIINSGRFSPIGFVDSIIYARKKSDLNIFDNAGNALTSAMLAFKFMTAVIMRTLMPWKFKKKA